MGINKNKNEDKKKFQPEQDVPGQEKRFGSAVDEDLDDKQNRTRDDKDVDDADDEQDDLV